MCFLQNPISLLLVCLWQQRWKYDPDEQNAKRRDVRPPDFEICVRHALVDQGNPRYGNFVECWNSEKRLKWTVKGFLKEFSQYLKIKFLAGFLGTSLRHLDLWGNCWGLNPRHYSHESVRGFSVKVFPHFLKISNLIPKQLARNRDKMTAMMARAVIIHTVRW